MLTKMQCPITIILGKEDILSIKDAYNLGSQYYYVHNSELKAG